MKTLDGIKDDLKNPDLAYMWGLVSGIIIGVFICRIFG